VLVPTRELAAQVQRALHQVAAARSMRIATVYGGVGYDKQRAALRHGTEIVVACPGRLEDLIEQRDVHLDDVSIVVVDEADRMADMGFLPAVKRILDKCKKDRQTMLFSATLDGDVDVLIKRYQNNPRRHDAAISEEKQGEVEHHFWHAAREERVQLLVNLTADHESALVFCRTRHGAERLSKQLSRSGVSAAAIHGSRTQPQRDKALANFQAGKVKVLVATDVAARGIHVDNVSVVVHFDPPGTDKDYVHRSGRTGRAGADGTVVTLVGREHQSDIRTLQRALGMPQLTVEPKVSSTGNGNGIVVHKPIDRPAGKGAPRHARRHPRGRGRRSH
jgi:superfamily II DNA/RNA helicase